MNVIKTAFNEYAHRPKDETFTSIGSFLDNARQDREHCIERSYNLKDLRVITSGAQDDNNGLQLASPKNAAPMTHWSFGQLARTVGAPAAYLRTLPPAIAADALNYGLTASAPGTTANILLRTPNGQPAMIRACTSDTYARIYDEQLYGSIARQLMDATHGKFQLPMTWSGEPGGAYRGDRDAFLIAVNGGSIVTDPSLTNRRSTFDGKPNVGGGPSDGLYRGIMVRNSEVGSCAVVIETVLFEYICGNLMLWGAVIDKSFRRRHVGANALRDTMRELGRIAWQWTERSASQDETIIRALIDNEIAHTREAVIDELQKIGATKTAATEAYDRCEARFNASPRSWWGIAQGLTNVSQDAGYQDERYELDKLAATVLARGRKLVAA